MKRLLHTSATFAAALLLAAAATSASAQTALRFGHYGPVGDPVHIASLKFKEIVEKESGGAFRIDVTPAEQLGKGSEMIVGTQLGTIDLSVTGNPFFGGLAPEQSALDIPFLFRTPEHAYRVMDGPIGRELMDKLESKNLKGLAYWEIGFRNLTNSARPIRSPADLKGMKLRTTPNPMHVEAFKIWGANPAPLPISETYLALSNKTVDGQENPTVLIAKFKFHEVQKHLSITRHAYTAAPLVMNLAKFKALSPAHQALMLKAAVGAGLVERQFNASIEAESLALIKKAGVEVVDNINIEPFRAQAYDRVRKMYTDKFGGDVLSKIDALK